MRGHRVVYVLVAACLAGCGRGPVSGAVAFTYAAPTWFEDGWSYYDVSPDEAWAAFGARFGRQLVDLRRGRMDSTRFESAASLRAARGEPAEIFFGTAEPHFGPTIPSTDLVRWSADGSRVFHYGPQATGLWAGDTGATKFYELGGTVTGAAWVPAGDLIYALVLQADGLCSLIRITLETGWVLTLRQGLDAPHRFNSIGVSPDATQLFLALASDTVPDPAARHRPDALRFTRIYALTLRDDQLRPLTPEGTGDAFRPQVAGDHLYWTQNDFTDDIVTLPTTGGDATTVVPGGQLPYWRPDGKAIAYSYGGWRIADWALNLDAAVVTVDDSAHHASVPRPIVTGYHEDFTPNWSPDGTWIAYHSHRSAVPVADYSSPGSSDDIYLRRPDAPMSEEIRLTDFGWEVGPADWAPDGRHLVLDSWTRGGAGAGGGAAGMGRPWVVTIDPQSGRAVNANPLALPPTVPGTMFEAWSPRGDQIAFIAELAHGRQALWVTSADGRSARKLVEFDAATYGGLDWTPDGGSLVYGGLVGGREQLFSVSLNQGTVTQLTHDDAGIILPQVSPDGRWIAATRIRRLKELRRTALP